MRINVFRKLICSLILNDYKVKSSYGMNKLPQERQPTAFQSQS